MLRRSLLAFALALAASVPGVAQDGANIQTPGVVAFDYGYFCRQEPSQTQEAPGTISGVLNLLDRIPPFIRRTTVIPAQLGLSFGVTLEVAPEYAGPVTVMTEHPPVGPKGQTVETWQSEFTVGDPDYNGFTFDEPFELVPGEWTFRAFSEGRLVYEITFEVVDTGGATVIECGTYLS